MKTSLPPRLKAQPYTPLSAGQVLAMRALLPAMVAFLASRESTTATRHTQS